MIKTDKELKDALNLEEEIDTSLTFDIFNKEKDHFQSAFEELDVGPAVNDDPWNQNKPYWELEGVQQKEPMYNTLTIEFEYDVENVSNDFLDKLNGLLTAMVNSIDGIKDMDLRKGDTGIELWGEVRDDLHQVEVKLRKEDKE